MENTAKNKNNGPVRPVPDGFHTVTPYLVVDEAEKLIQFIKKAFEGELLFISKTDSDRVTHATVKINDSVIMISDTMGDMKPQNAMLFLYVNNVDSIYERAIKAKGESVQVPKDEFYGDRASAVKDPFGNTWWIATHIEDVNPEELDRRAQKAHREWEEKQSVHN